MAQHWSEWSIIDYSNEKSPFKIYNGAITAASIGGFLTAIGAMRTALAAMTLGTVGTEKWVGDSTQLSPTPPTDPDAQRERKALITYKGNTSNKIYTATIPAVRVKTTGGDSLLLPASDMYDLTLEPTATFVTNFNGFGRTPDSDTENVTILSIRTVGRNI